jgi:hypothetical protein
MEPESSLPCSQHPVTGPYSELDESSPHIRTLFIRHPPILIVSSYALIFQAFFSFIFLNQNFKLISHMRSKRPSHLIPPDFVLLIIFGKK